MVSKVIKFRITDKKNGKANKTTLGNSLRN